VTSMASRNRANPSVDQFCRKGWFRTLSRIDGISRVACDGQLPHFHLEVHIQARSYEKIQSILPDGLALPAIPRRHPRHVSLAR